jgi:ATP-dependent Clp protease ATP-binding subunit ClpA
MNVEKILDNAEKLHSNEVEKYAAEVAKQLFANYESLELLASKRKALKHINEVVAGKFSSDNRWGNIFSGMGNSNSAREQLLQSASGQAQLIGCPHIDEHSLLLASLRILDKATGSSLYKPALKEMLQTSLHKLDRIELKTEFIGRQKELEESLRIISRDERNNLLIVGDVGVGKTALAQQLKKQLQPRYKLLQIYPGGDNFFDQIVNVLSQQVDAKVVFYLDEMFTFTAGQIKYLIDSSQVIGTANEDTYRKFAGENPHITSKFEILRLEETDENTSIEILEKNIERLYEAKQVSFEEGLAEKTYAIAKKYLQEGNFPAKGITLLQEAASQAQMHETQLVSDEQLKVIVSQKTNIPIGSLTDLDKQDLSSLPERIKKRVKGQDEAVSKVAQAIQRSRLGFKKGNKPIGSFLFVGPSGVGKTELAKTVAKEIFGDEEAMIRLDMSEYSEAHMVQRLIGSPPGYIGYEEGGQLTNPVKEKPYTLVLLDEIEKGHPKVFDIFLQVLDDGRLTDGRGQKVDFTNTIVIATSNAGIEDILDLIEEGRSKQEINSEIKEILQDYFRLEFINRFDEVVIFDALQTKALAGIAKNQIEKLQTELDEKQIQLEVSDEFIKEIAKSAYDPRYGARGLLRLIQERIENVLAEGILSGEIKDGELVRFENEKQAKSDDMNSDGVNTATKVT